MKKTFLIIFFLSCIIFSCSDEPTDETANYIFHDVFSAVNDATTSAKNAATNQNIVPTEPREGQTQISWESPSGTIAVTGSWSNDNYPKLVYNLNITFINHTTQKGTTLNGTVHNNVTVNASTTAFSYDLDGELDIIYNGTPYDFSWDVQVQGTFNPYSVTVSGGFYLNSTYFPAKL
ncbi:MAG: hypothetical protein N2316_08155 [Spirochaetes bacterium]|nr:hypothetical protein [Spirochaetota bacterium]